MIYSASPCDAHTLQALLFPGVHIVEIFTLVQLWGITLGDIIYLEILQGIKNDKEFDKTRNSLSTLEQYPLLGTDMVTKCAANFRFLRKKGLTIRKTADVIIATFCIENKMPLLFVDRDFKPFVTHLGLKPVYLGT